MGNVLAVAALIEQLSILGTNLLKAAQANGDPTPAEWQASFDRAKAAADQFHSLLEQAKANTGNNSQA